MTSMKHSKNAKRTQLRQEIDFMTISGQIAVIVEKIGADKLAEELGVSKTTILRWSNPEDNYLPNAKQLVDMDAIWCKQTGGQPFLLPFLNNNLSLSLIPMEEIVKFDLEEESLYCVSLAVDMAMAMHIVQNTPKRSNNKSLKEATSAAVQLKRKLDIIEYAFLAEKIHNIELSNKKSSYKKIKDNEEQLDTVIESYLKRLKSNEKELHFLVSNIYNILKNKDIPAKKKDAVMAADVLEDVANKLIDMADYYRYSVISKQ